MAPARLAGVPSRSLAHLTSRPDAAALKERDGTPVAESIRRAIRAYLEVRGIIEKTDRKRASTRKRP
jgi:hypothetical protein